MDVATVSPPTSARSRGSSRIAGTPRALEQGLLVCGFAAAAHYVAMLIVVPVFWPGYSSTSHAISELSAIGAPTRHLWVALGWLWTALYAAFGIGVWLAADRSRMVRTAGALIILSAIAGLAWPIAWTPINAVLTLLAMALSAAALGRRFRLGTITVVIVMLLTSAETAILARRLDQGLATPWFGLWERMGVGAWLLWIVMLASALLWRRLHGGPAHASAGGDPAITMRSG